MRKYLSLLVLVSLAACSSTAASDPSSDGSTASPAPSTSPTTTLKNQGETPDQGVDLNQDRTQMPASSVTIPPVTEVPSDLKSGEGRALIIDQPSMFGVHQFAVSYANAVVNTISRYLAGAQVDMSSLLAGAEFQESSIPVVPNIKKRTVTQLGESGIRIEGELSNTPTPSFSVAYVCLLNGGAYTSLSACTGG